MKKPGPGAAGNLLDPEDPDNYVFMARLYSENGNKGKALEMLEKASGSDNATVSNGH